MRMSTILSNINLCEVASLFFISTNLYKRQVSAYACVTRGTGSECGRRLLDMVSIPEETLGFKLLIA